MCEITRLKLVFTTIFFLFAIFCECITWANPSDAFLWRHAPCPITGCWMKLFYRFKPKYNMERLYINTNSTANSSRLLCYSLLLFSSSTSNFCDISPNVTKYAIKLDKKFLQSKAFFWRMPNRIRTDLIHRWDFERTSKGHCLFFTCTRNNFTQDCFTLVHIFVPCTIFKIIKFVASCCSQYIKNTIYQTKCELFFISLPKIKTHSHVNLLHPGTFC